MSSEFQPRYLPCDSNIATSHRRLYSTILAEFPWYSESLVLKPESILAYSNELPEFEACGQRVKDGLEAFSRLQDWPKMATTFKNLIPNPADGISQFHDFSNPLFSLMHMAAKNTVKTKYLAIEENFLLAAIHIAAIKNIPFAAGTIPDLPADLPSMPPGGFQDINSYNSFELEYNAFLKKCQTEGCPLSAHVRSRSPFQLACLISPLYLLATIRLSTKSFHRRTVIDLAAKLGPHKSPRVLAVESLIWDALFRLAEGHTSAYVVLRDLAQSLPWSDIDSAARCDADKQCFFPALPMSYAPAIYFAEPKLLLPPPSSPSVLCPITASNAFGKTLGRIPNTVFAGTPLDNHLPMNPLQLTSPSATSTPVDAVSSSKSSLDSSSEPASSSGNPPSPSVPCPTVSDSFANALVRTLNTVFAGAPLGNNLPVWFKKPLGFELRTTQQPG
ncbi:hypothetical protein K443DRAFT_15357 [Laccaria amethystina LaAM-08-1]|uniref:Uncharacterized protein n=1 Tax=Laccaria amethystina LaAM-08-1 TaxID=1095629 RepID=A0A0C9WGZ2_9AGAR|nr:hypothetical protein K443DRAFT_15357 [Laccaria amethystina LaAM-08-1]